ncbi:MAG: hypothetical protein RBT41_02375 [Clostridia bacterium]|jgi:hypothetical protein|nr:hypothetical protein [Clostridia bacterium]
MQMPFLSWLLQGIPESIGIAAVVYSFSSRQIRWKYPIFIGLIYAVFMYVIRLLPLTFGVHTVILIFILAILSTLIAKIDLRKAIINANIAIIILALSEIISVYIAVRMGGLASQDIIFTNQFYRIVVGMPPVITLYSAAILYSYRARLVKNMEIKEV